MNEASGGPTEHAVYINISQGLVRLLYHCHRLTHPNIVVAIFIYDQ